MLEKSETKDVVLVIAAHPDDEVLGCGGAVAKHAARGDDVHILIMAEGITSRDETRNVNNRQKELTSLAQIAKTVGLQLGARTVEILSLPDNRMDTLPLLDIVKAVEIRLESIRPSIVYTHHHGDLNIDHQITHHAVITACRPYPQQTVKVLLFFEVLSSTDWQTPNPLTAFIPNWFVDLSDCNRMNYLEEKIQALTLYAGETRCFPHARSLKAVKYLACQRGSSIGVAAAEAFMIGRCIK